MFENACSTLSLGYCRRLSQTALRPGWREPMGQRAARLAYGWNRYPEGGCRDAPHGLVTYPSKFGLLFCPTLIRRYAMPHGRPTTDPKGESIRIRINDEMRKRLEKKSSQTGQSISQIIRNLITQNLN